MHSAREPRLVGDPFFVGGVAATPVRSLNLSCATLITVGYGNLTARTDFGRTLAFISALLGQLYLVMVASGGAANLVPRRRLDGGDSP